MAKLAKYVDPEESAGYQVRRCHRSFDRLLTSFLSQHGIKTGYWYYLRILWMEEGVSQKYLSDKTNVAENTTASIINAMMEDALLVRERDAADKRKFNIWLTDRGRALEGELMGYAAKINQIAAQGIDQAEIDQCLTVLKRMSENLAQAFSEQ